MGSVIINWWRGYFLGEGQEKILLCKEGSLHEKKEYMGDVFC